MFCSFVDRRGGSFRLVSSFYHWWASRSASSEDSLHAVYIFQLFTQGALASFCFYFWAVWVVPHLGTESEQGVIMLRATATSRAICLAPIKYCHPYPTHHNPVGTIFPPLRRKPTEACLSGMTKFLASPSHSLPLELA